MPISMPTYTQLSDEQKSILEDASFDETLMVTGPPGTGKTVIALWQSKQMSDSRDMEVSLIMYNRVLRKYTEGWEDLKKSRVKVKTYHAWTFNIWKNVKGKRAGFPPQEPKYNYVWGEIGPELLKAKNNSGTPMNFGRVVIDEAQDFSKEFYKQLGLLSATAQVGVSVVADENQRLDESQNSSLDEIESSLQLGGKVQKYSLTRNYRNTLQIDALARCFYVGLQTGQADAPRDREGSTPILSAHTKGSGGTDGMMEAISRYAKNNPSQSILVICADKKQMALLGRAITKRLDSHHVAMYAKAKDEEGLKTGESESVTLVHWKSMKGVEADAVFVPQLERFDLGQDSIRGESMRLYVMCSRARLYLELMYDHAAFDHRLVELIRDKSAGAIKERFPVEGH
jgi:DNA helicase II / ATP-dependent DNA helicase PcrA